MKAIRYQKHTHVCHQCSQHTDEKRNASCFAPRAIFVIWWQITLEGGGERKWCLIQRVSEAAGAEAWHSPIENRGKALLIDRLRWGEEQINPSQPAQSYSLPRLHPRRRDTRALKPTLIHNGVLPLLFTAHCAEYALCHRTVCIHWLFIIQP